LLRADVDVVDFVAADQYEVAGLAGIDQFGDDSALVVKLHVGLRDGVPVFFPRGKIERERINLRGLFALLFQLRVDFFELVLLHVVADFVIAVAGVDHADVIDHPAALDLAVRRFDEAVVVDAGIATQR